MTKKIIENKSLVFDNKSNLLKYIKRNFPTAFEMDEIDDKTIIRTRNCMGIIKKDTCEYRIYSKVADTMEVFRILEKVTSSKYKFKVNKKFVYFDPKEKIKVENGMYILNQFIDIFILEIKKIRNIGLSKIYEKQCNNLRFIKGKIDFNKNIKYNNIMPIKTYCEYNEMTYRTDENIILCLALIKIVNSKRITDDQRLKIVMLKNEFIDILNMDISRVMYNRLKYKKNRLNSYYENCISIARMILEGDLFSSMKEGNNIFCNFIVSTDTLFERYIFLLLKELLEEKYQELSIEEQVHLNVIKKINKENEFVGALQMYPDIVIYQNGIPLIILDTKYINLYGRNKLTNSAYYQMLSYLMCMKNIDNHLMPKGVLLGFGKEEANKYRLQYDEKYFFDILTRGVDILAEEKTIKEQLDNIIKECIL